MQPKEHYAAKHFKRYARKEFPDEFALFRDLYTCDLEDKTYLDENYAAHNAGVLLVGHYHTRKGSPSVWAQATSTGVKYYQGKAGETVCKPVPEEYVTRIYYSAPYSFLVGAQAGRSRTAGRKAEQYFVETIVSVLFLLAGRLEQVGNPGKTDMLSNFKYACMNTVPKPEAQELVSPTVLKQPKLSPAYNTFKRKNKKRKRSSHDHSQRIKEEEETGSDAGHSTNRPDPPSQSWNGPVQHLPSYSPMPYRIARDTLQTPLMEQLHAYEADMTSKLEQEKQAHFDEVRALRVKLDEQELRTQAAEEKLFREKKKRNCAEEQVEDLRSQAVMPKESGSPEIECVGPAWHTCNSKIARQKNEINRASQVILTRNKMISELRKALSKGDWHAVQKMDR